MKSTLLSRRDLDFLLFEWLRLDELIKRERFAEHSTDTFGDVLTLCEQIAERYFAPHNKRGDTEEPTFDGTTVTTSSSTTATTGSTPFTKAPTASRALICSAARFANAAALGEEPAVMAAQLQHTWQRVLDVTATLTTAADIEAALANSSLYLDVFGHTVIAWLWFEQVLTASGQTGAFYDGKRYAARYFYRYELPSTTTQLGLLGRIDRTTLDLTLTA